MAHRGVRSWARGSAQALYGLAQCSGRGGGGGGGGGAFWSEHDDEVWDNGSKDTMDARGAHHPPSAGTVTAPARLLHAPPALQRPLSQRLDLPVPQGPHPRHTNRSAYAPTAAAAGEGAGAGESAGAGAGTDRPRGRCARRPDGGTRARRADLPHPAHPAPLAPASIVPAPAPAPVTGIQVAADDAPAPMETHEAGFSGAPAMAPAFTAARPGEC
jgi:hypothetical protein